MTNQTAERPRGTRGGQRVLLAAALIGLAVPVAGQDPPHWVGINVPIDCTTQCHTPHNSLGDNLTQAADNVNLCQSCHNPSGPYAEALPVTNSDKADRANRTGTSHAFDVLATQDFDGDGQDDVVTPSDSEMQLRVMGGNVVCSTCHNQHRSQNAAPYQFGGHSRIGLAQKITAFTSPDIVSGGTFTGPEGVWYLVQIVVAGDQNNARFCYSKDNGISWFPTGCDPPGTPTPNLTADGANPVALDSDATVTFPNGSYVLGEQWQFSAAWPFLRTTLDDPVSGAGSVMCRDCHGPWEMDHTAVEGPGDGVTVFSHPVGVPLNANGRGYDRATPLDGNGAVQAGPGADANASNDLLFDGAGDIQCLTCHGVHNVDGNTLTDDSR